MKTQIIKVATLVIVVLSSLALASHDSKYDDLGTTVMTSALVALVEIQKSSDDDDDTKK